MVSQDNSSMIEQHYSAAYGPFTAEGCYQIEQTICLGPGRTGKIIWKYRQKHTGELVYVVDDNTGWPCGMTEKRINNLANFALVKKGDRIEREGDRPGKIETIGPVVEIYPLELQLITKEKYKAKVFVEFHQIRAIIRDGKEIARFEA